MNRADIKKILLISLAIFSMFFGAGNTIYPIVTAIETTHLFSWSFLGLALTAIIGPLLGLVGGALYKGRCLDFFSRGGKKVGLVVLGACLALLGPFAVLPRCVSVAHAAVVSIFSICPLWLFAGIFCILSFLVCIRRRALLAILGYVLSPILIGCLLLIIGKGLALHVPLAISSWSAAHAFKFGLSTGYDTMDLIASIIFSAGIWGMVSRSFSSTPKSTLKITILAGSIACLFLGAIYFGLGHVAAAHSHLLQHIPKQELMSKLAILTLGPHLAIVANIAVALACLTTVVGLTMTISDIVSQELFPKRTSYSSCVALILLTTLIMTAVGFKTISLWIHSVISILYPLIIALTLVNIAVKLWGLRGRTSKQDSLT